MPSPLPLWNPACAGEDGQRWLSQSVSAKPYLDEVLGCFHAVADFDARGFAAHGVGEEGGDVVAVFGDVVYVLLQLF